MVLTGLTHTQLPVLPIQVVLGPWGPVADTSGRELHRHLCDPTPVRGPSALGAPPSWACSTGRPSPTPAQKAFPRPHKTRKTCSGFSTLPAFLSCLQPEVSLDQRVRPLRLILPMMTSDFLAMFLFYKWAVPKITWPGCPAASLGLCVSSWVRRPASPSAGFF